MEAYLADIEDLTDHSGFTVAVLATTKKEAKEKLRELYPYKSRINGYSIYIRRHKVKLIN